jgi:DNA-binding MurR/RpiR family transcriptional regulator
MGPQRGCDVRHGVIIPLTVLTGTGIPFATLRDGPGPTLPPVNVRERIQDLGDSLTKAERRVAEVVLVRPEVVAFGTVAELAAAAQAGAATVVRLAGKLGFDGFSALQGAVQGDMARRLRPAAERIRNPLPDDVIGRATHLELDNVHETLGTVDRRAFDRAVALLSDLNRRVFVLAGEAERGVATQFESELHVLRDGVGFVFGSDVGIARTLATVRTGDVVVAVDMRRYERWLLDTLEALTAQGCQVIAVTDSVLSPLARGAEAAFVVSAAGAGPFDSHVGTLAVLNAIVAACAGALRTTASERIDRIEHRWSERNLLTDN